MERREINNMKLNTINAIKVILKNEVHNRHLYLKNMRYNLSQKYGDNWTENDITEVERYSLHSQMKMCNEIDEIYDDFMNHNW